MDLETGLNLSSNPTLEAVQMGKWNDFLDGQLVLPISEYMKLALYGPDGYYTRRVKIGGAGRDFFTSASFSLFAKTLANASFQVWHRGNRPTSLQIVEWGAGEGSFAKFFIPSLLEKLSGQAVLTYVIEEKSDELKFRQWECLQNVRDQLLKSDGELKFGFPTSDAPMTIVIGNEVLDAMPVERLQRTSHQWLRETIRIDSETNLTVSQFEPAPVSLSRLADLFLPIGQNQISEIVPNCYEDVFQTCASYGNNVCGWFFDYGIHRAELESGLRPMGTLRGYHEHQLCSPFELPGQVDITSDVVWDAAQKGAMQAGFHNVFMKSQSQFLMDAEILQELEQWKTQEKRSPLAIMKQTNELKQLVFPGGLGERFEVLCFKKGDNLRV